MALPALRDLARRPIFVALLVLAIVLLTVRIILPLVVTRYVNRVLNDIEGYEGRITDVDLAIWRGAYSIHDVEIVHVSPDGQRAPVLLAPIINLSIEWPALFHGALVGQIELHQPRVNIYAGPAKKEEKRKADDFMERVHRLFPFTLNRFAVVDGELHFQNLRAKPDVDIYLDRIELVARNLTNIEEVSDALPATVSGEARAMQSGRLTIEMKLNPTAEHPTYELAFELKELRLPEINTFLKHYLSVAARDGWISLIGESKAREGRFYGYVKPLVRDLDILQTKKESKGAGEAIKAFFVKIIAKVFENKSKEQLAARIEFSGTFDNPQISVWEAVASFLRNAFVQALEPRLEGSVAPEQVQKERRKEQQRGSGR